MFELEQSLATGNDNLDYSRTSTALVQHVQVELALADVTPEIVDALHTIIVV